MYQEYWGLSEAPFDNVPDPGIYFRMHASVENAIAELLFAIEEGNECLALLIGGVGLGKTMALRVILDKLEHFNRFLLETAEAGQKVLLFVDEGQALRGPVLESMRLLTSIQENKRNMLTIILAGQPELGTMLTAPRRANLLQRVGVCPILEPLGSEDLVGDSIDHRMEKAGSTRNVFTNSGIASVYEFSEGVPRLINRFCKLCLKAGETNRLNEINAEVVSTVATQFQPSHILQGLADARGTKEARIQQNPGEPAANQVAEIVSPGQKSTPAAERPLHDIINTESLAHEDRDIGPQTESLDTGPRIENGQEPLVDPERSQADHNAESVSSSRESIPGSVSHSIEETHAIESDCRVSVESQLNGNPSQPQSGLDPVGDYSDRLPSEPETSELAERSFSGDPRTETLTYEDQDIEPQAESLDTGSGIEKNQEAVVDPEERPADQNFNAVSASQESISGSMS